VVRKPIRPRWQIPIEILVVEDNFGDVRLMREVMLGVNDSICLHMPSDGVEAMAFLNREGDYIRAPRPDLILLDLNMPKLDGREVLARVKADVKLKTIPIIVLTASRAEMDIVKSYQLHASCYLSKPGELNEFEQLIKSINHFWLTRVSLPGQTAKGDRGSVVRPEKNKGEELGGDW
jgi:chemotaxis family two-component system response regulator Rcp1